MISPPMSIRLNTAPIAEQVANTAPDLTRPEADYATALCALNRFHSQ